MKRVNFSTLMAASALLITGAVQASSEPAKLTQAVDAITASWSSTETNLERHDLLAERPALIWLWAGSGYDKQFNSPRGHQLAVSDVTTILRTGSGEKSASCWTCKGPGSAKLIDELGENGFASRSFAEVGSDMTVSVGCKDCHAEGDYALQLPRPHAQKAMAKIHMPFAEQNKRMQGAQTCGQCHVTYYFQPEQANRVNIPWIFGSSADLIEKYYDTRQFYDWIHPISGAPMVKARHPEFEHWSRSAHAELGVTCITCHMPEQKDANGRAFHDHNVSHTWQNFDGACSGCHDSETQLKQQVANRKQQINQARTEVEALLVKAHAEAGALTEARVSFSEMGAALMDIRHAQWRWDFATSSHGVHAHNPKEGLELLAVAKRQATMARARLEVLLDKYPDAKVVYPDLSSKAAAHKAIGFDEAKAQAQKEAFLAEKVKGKWPSVTSLSQSQSQ
ncbi:ammonia-forming cytochrome c nitrite reductase subunit c552 [Ferrimonas aestuarii]|uniref:nitrite reductase (cytochrome; ammonia-forming) n=1 Tax=Ferrimonas aestuarii TaxID=2569539 RepID=A0A4U1BU47_9GAMM|nr:ammonia-forming cytochrome c nitrite reductase subunit c552 [Ferrimonas aestuarii]TKB58739.1 ammonia-forming cytochrome c nitrite reductase subunit c552 [Ferrimonas aestuarii]